MGHASYSVENRTSSSNLRTAAYASATMHFATTGDEAVMDTVFTQNKLRTIHESMAPKGITVREARDSAAHPNSLPIILALDVTGSMGRIPYDMIATGLPKLMGKITQHGTPDAALLFLAIGDIAVDRYPLQVGQFESGDEELDTWLTRTYVEKGGGGNAGESYNLAWYFAAHHTATDAWDKRKQKGFLFTVGDEPSLEGLPKNAIEGLMHNKLQSGFTNADLIAAARERYHVFHLHILEGSAGQRSAGFWRNLLGQDSIEVADHTKVAEIIAEKVVDVLKNEGKAITATPATKESFDGSHTKPEEML